MALTVSEEVEAGGVRVRVAPMDVGRREFAVVAQTVGECCHEDLWLVTAITRPAAVADQVAMAVCGPTVDVRGGEEVDVIDIIDHDLALWGLPWRALDERAARVQLEVSLRAPEWLIEVPTEQIWALREFVHGSSLGRFALALEICHAAYVVEGPARWPS